MIKLNSLKLRRYIKVPPSKSHTMRALIFAFMADGESVIENYLHSPDVEAMLNLGDVLGAQVTLSKDVIKVVGVSGLPNIKRGSVVNAGNSGLVLRMGIAMAALGCCEVEFCGDDSLVNNRPLDSLVSALRHMGVSVSSDKLPFTICGPIKSYIANINGKDSQPVSALLMALSVLGKGGRCTVVDAGEKPWIDVTLWWLEKLGYVVSHENYSEYYIDKSNIHNGFKYRVPSDFSSAAYPIVAALIKKQVVTILDLDFDDIQGDKRIIDVLQKMGARFDIQGSSCTVLPAPKLYSCSVDIDDMVDALPLLAVLGCYSEGEMCLYNAHIARKKESDRLSAITFELTRMGADMQEFEDKLIIKTSALRGTKVCAHKDHRIAMSLIIASLGAKGGTVLDGDEWIMKSFPDFTKNLFVDNIVIVGFKSSGKSSMGRRLSECNRLNFIDLDGVIERLFYESNGEQLSCREIYIKYGKVYFRNLEKDAVLSLRGLQRTVLATGGGVVEDKDNMLFLSQWGKICYIKVGFEEICRRLDLCGWPAYANSRSDLKIIFDKREKLYELYAEEVRD